LRSSIALRYIMKGRMRGAGSDEDHGGDGLGGVLGVGLGRRGRACTGCSSVELCSTIFWSPFPVDWIPDRVEERCVVWSSAIAIYGAPCLSSSFPYHVALLALEQAHLSNMHCHIKV